MKAAIVKKYGGPEVAVIHEVTKPTITKPNQIVVKIMSSSVNSGDARIRRADPWFIRLAFGFSGPRKQILGIVFAGVVESVGSAITKYAVGDRVYGMSETIMSGHAEYIVLPETTAMEVMPDSMTFVDAAALPFGGTTALHFLHGVELAGKTVFINGASGAVGLCFLQIAKSRGALVTAVTSTPNIGLMKELGANTVIDYTTTDVMTDPIEYDVAIDCVNKIPLPLIERFVKKGGVVILLAGLIKEMWQSRKLKKAHVKVGPAKVLHEHFAEINALYSDGKLRPIIDEIFPLEEIATAYARVDGGSKVGSVVLTMRT